MMRLGNIMAMTGAASAAGLFSSAEQELSPALKFTGALVGDLFDNDNNGKITRKEIDLFFTNFPDSNPKKRDQSLISPLVYGTAEWWIHRCENRRISFEEIL